MSNTPVTNLCRAISVPSVSYALTAQEENLQLLLGLLLSEISVVLPPPPAVKWQLIQDPQHPWHRNTWYTHTNNGVHGSPTPEDVILAATS